MAEQTDILTANSTRTITATADTLFAIAARELGDATQWNRIAEFNQIDDPWIDTAADLRLPHVSAEAGNGGILRVVP